MSVESISIPSQVSAPEPIPVCFTECRCEDSGPRPFSERVSGPVRRLSSEGTAGPPPPLSQGPVLVPPELGSPYTGQRTGRERPGQSLTTLRNCPACIPHDSPAPASCPRRPGKTFFKLPEPVPSLHLICTVNYLCVVLIRPGRKRPCAPRKGCALPADFYQELIAIFRKPHPSGGLDLPRLRT